MRAVYRAVRKSFHRGVTLIWRCVAGVVRAVGGDIACHDRDGHSTSIFPTIAVVHPGNPRARITTSLKLELLDRERYGRIVQIRDLATCDLRGNRVRAGSTAASATATRDRDGVVTRPAETDDDHADAHLHVERAPVQGDFDRDGVEAFCSIVRHGPRVWDRARQPGGGATRRAAIKGARAGEHRPWGNMTRLRGLRRDTRSGIAGGGAMPILLLMCRGRNSRQRGATGCDRIHVHAARSPAAIHNATQHQRFGAYQGRGRVDLNRRHSL